MVCYINCGLIVECFKNLLVVYKYGRGSTCVRGTRVIDFVLSFSLELMLTFRLRLRFVSINQQHQTFFFFNNISCYNSIFTKNIKINLSFVVFYLVYVFIFNLCFDKVYISLYVKPKAVGKPKCSHSTSMK